MAESAEELVHRVYQRLVARKGVAKGAGAAVVDYHELTAEVVAEIGVQWRDQLRRAEKALKANGKRLRVLAEAHGAMTRPLVPGRGLVDLDLEKHGVTLANRPPVDGEYQPWYPGHSVAPENDGN